MSLNVRTAHRVPVFRGEGVTLDHELRAKVLGALNASLEGGRHERATSMLSSDDLDLRPDQRQRVYYSEVRARVGTRPKRYGW